ncbi:MAG: endonuclease V [Candidatus Bathyarchaeales archaeon]
MSGVPKNFSVWKAHETQIRLSKKIVFEDKLPKKIRYVAGVDVAYAKNLSIGAVAVLDYDTLRLLECKTAVCETRFPYMPTLLSFREVPPAVSCIKKLQIQPDVFLVDGHGFAHPYRCGFASHLGLVLGKPTIGVAKGRLCGEEEHAHGEPITFLKHDGKIIGAAVTTKSGCKPVYVSVGHMVSLETAVKIVQHCTVTNRIPEPILRAHEAATAEKRKINMRSGS